MLKTHQNRIFKLIQELNLDITEFSINDYSIEQGNKIFEVLINKEGFSFSFQRSLDNYHLFKTSYTKFTPNKLRTTWEPLNEFYSFERALELFKNWLTVELKEYWEESSTPNLWKQYSYFGNWNSFDQNEFEKEEQFTEQEKNEIIKALEEIKVKLIEKFFFDQSKINLVDVRISYLQDKTEKSTKIDWKNLALATFIGIVTNLTTDVETGHKIWLLIITILERMPELPFAS